MVSRCLNISNRENRVRGSGGEKRCQSVPTCNVRGGSKSPCIPSSDNSPTGSNCLSTVEISEVWREETARFGGGDRAEFGFLEAGDVYTSSEQGVSNQFAFVRIP